MARTERPCHVVIAGRKRPSAKPLALVLAIPIMCIGCASTEPPAPTTGRISIEEARADFGTLAVATVEGIPSVSLGRPVSRGKGAAEGALIGLAPLIIGVELGPGGTFLGILLTPLTTIVGTVYGALAGKSSDQVERAAQVLQRAGQATEVQYHLRDLVINKLGREQFGGVISVGGADKAKFSVNTVVEVWINEITLVGEGINPRLTLRLSGDMRVLRTGVETGYLWVNSWGQKHTLMEWAADDAKIFRAQIAQESEELAQKIVDTMLSRPLPTTRPLGPPVKYGTVTSTGPERVVVTGKENGRDATWTFIVDSKTAIRKSGKDVTVADLTSGDSVVVYVAPNSTVAQLISVLAGPTEDKVDEPAPAEKR